ncbi:hypothetical protein FLT15_02850 [Paenibacillus thiaminolyticus]|uniref:CatA-like O-acetyltransferase n=1 Tax=Paenibacillus thiaminolyticus TaxID=49283 RepID=UPI001162AE3B|nr:hypothetical protein [Paenibacillus thiaminolyticus]
MFCIIVSHAGKCCLSISIRTREQDGQTRLPVSLQMHHTVCDGSHASVFLNELEGLAQHCGEGLTME